jgi:hypothetical protein
VRWFSWLCMASISLAGCATRPGVSHGAEDGQSVIPNGYLYQDTNHPNWPRQSSPQAEYNAAHRTWLWPPARTR